VTTGISEERAARIAKSHPCERCGEFSYKRVKVRPAPDSQREALDVVWQVITVCGVCGAEHEIGIANDGDIVYVG
jgi:hypothetical protein